MSENSGPFGNNIVNLGKCGLSKIMITVTYDKLIQQKMHRIPKVVIVTELLLRVSGSFSEKENN